MESSALLSFLSSLEGNCRQLAGVGSGNASVREIGDGNMNFVYVVSWKTGEEDRSVAVKYTPNYIRCLGPDYTLTKDRLRVEYLALCRFHEAAPGLCPEPFEFDSSASLLVMEDLSTHTILRGRIMAGDVNVESARNVGRFAAAVHSRFQQLACTEEEWKKLLEDFENKDMVEITSQYIFQKPYDADDKTNKHSSELNDLVAEVRGDEKVRLAVSELLSKFSGHQQCLVHGDLHSGSVMVCGPSLKVFDAEFAFVGPAAFDVGLFLIQYCISWLAHRQKESAGSQLLKSLSDSLQEAWSAYCKAAKLGTKEREVMWNDSLGFGACEGMRRVIGAAHLADLSGLPRAEAAVIRLCRILLVERQHSIQNVSQLLAAMEKVSQMDI